MINIQLLDEITQQITKILPPSIRNMNDSLQKNLRATLMNVFEKFDLVTRDEFDAQQRVLHRALNKLELLEKKIDDLENHQNK